MSGEYLPAITVGRIALGRNVMAIMNRLAKATSAVNLATNTSRIRTGNDPSAR